MDFRKAATAVHAALEEAEKMSGTTVDSIYLAQTGAHLNGQMLRGSASVVSADNRVTVDDLKRASLKQKEGSLIRGDRMFICKNTHHFGSKSSG